MNTSNTTLTDNSAILPYQRSVFERMCSVAKACLFVHRSQFKIIRPRYCFWLIGATGTGKSHLSKTLAKEVGVPIFSISASDWIVLGNSNGGSNNTWPLIVKFIIKNLKALGAIIFIDEVDKCAGNSEWNTFLRTEVFSLCDGRVPPGIKDNDSNSNTISDEVIADVEDFLKNKTMIIGGSAFQNIWEKDSMPSIGFAPISNEEPTTPELSDLTTILPRELVNRFSSEMFILPQIKEQDYQDMIQIMADHIPLVWRKRFVSIGMDNIDTAVQHQKGARYLEETLLSAIVAERAYLMESFPQNEVEMKDESECKNDDDIHIF